MRYRAFTREFDRIERAVSLMEEQERTALDERREDLAQSRWARSGRDEEEPLSQFEERLKQLSRPGGVDILLLLDLSGSTRSAIISGLIEILQGVCDRLDASGIKFEVLGYTTNAWRGGRAKEAWSRALREGRPVQGPGRLNELLHVVFKDRDEPWPGARRNLSMMCADGFLKENIDGEALQWAHARTQSRPGREPGLLVIGDLQPCDQATIGANPADILCEHLVTVVSELSRDVHLHSVRLLHEGSDLPGGIEVGKTVDVSIKDTAAMATAICSQVVSLIESCQEFAPDDPTIFRPD